MPITGREKAEFNELYQQTPELVAGAGPGLVLDGSGNVTVNPDGVTLEVSGSNQLQVKGLGVDSEQLSALSVTTEKIDNDSVDKTKIAADIAGNGLGQAAGGELDVGVDDSSIEINADLLRVKALGITDAMLATDKWIFKSGNPASSAATAEPNTIYAGKTGGTSYIYICASAGWGPGGTPENWMRVALAAF